MVIVSHCDRLVFVMAKNGVVIDLTNEDSSDDDEEL